MDIAADFSEKAEYQSFPEHSYKSVFSIDVCTENNKTD